MSHVYKITVVLNANWRDGVRDLTTSINETMKSFGFDEKLVLTNELPLHLTVERVLTSQEEVRIGTLLIESLATSLPGSNPKIKNFELQP